MQRRPVGRPTEKRQRSFACSELGYIVSPKSAPERNRHVQDTHSSRRFINIMHVDILVKPLLAPSELSQWCQPLAIL